MAEKGKDSALFVGSLEKGMKVFHAFSREHRELRLSEIVEITGLDRSAAQRFAYSLHTLGYLVQDPRTKLFRLSPKTLELALSYLQSDPLIEAALPVLQQCRRETGETVNLSELNDTDVVFVARVPGDHAVNVSVSIGSSFPAFCTAPGRAMLAFLTADSAEAILKRSTRRSFTEHTKTDLQQIRQEIKAARAQGFCVAVQEIYLGEISIAAPVFDMARQPVGALNIPLPTARWTVENVQTQLGSIVVKFADRITALNGGIKP